jgi:hypothetical protein
LHRPAAILPQIEQVLHAHFDGVTSNDDVHRSGGCPSDGPWTFRANVLASHTPAQSISIGQLEANCAK